jgi:hypothetical protein
MVCPVGWLVKFENMVKTVFLIFINRIELCMFLRRWHILVGHTDCDGRLGNGSESIRSSDLQRRILRGSSGGGWRWIRFEVGIGKARRCVCVCVCVLCGCGGGLVAAVWATPFHDPTEYTLRETERYPVRSALQVYGPQPDMVPWHWCLNCDRGDLGPLCERQQTRPGQAFIKGCGSITLGCCSGLVVSGWGVG